MTPQPDSDSSMFLEADRLLLQTWREADWIHFLPIATDPRVMRYINDGLPWSDEQVRSFVNRQIDSFHKNAYCRWKLVYKSTQKLIGFCGVGRWKGEGEPEIGWWLAQKYWGQGIATEAARVALHDAFERVHFPRLISVAYRENRPSIRIMEKLGLHHEKDFVSDGIELVQYAITAEEYARAHR